ncbi:MAG TPA: response regulator [Myxococcaceae bacterium]|jgi:CheY-like chemotaxis protein
MAKRRILVIDDSEGIHQIFCRILCPKQPVKREALDEMEKLLFGKAGPSRQATEEIFELDSAYQGQEGLAKVKEAIAAGRPYALVFLDYRMPPGWNGFETLRELRKVAPDVPVVLCSAYSDHSWDDIAQEFGGEHHVTELRKPFDQSSLHNLAMKLSEPSGAAAP